MNYLVSEFCESACACSCACGWYRFRVINYEYRFTPPNLNVVQVHQYARKGPTLREHETYDGGANEPAAGHVAAGTAGAAEPRIALTSKESKLPNQQHQCSPCCCRPLLPAYLPQSFLPSDHKTKHHSQINKTPKIVKKNWEQNMPLSPAPRGGLQFFNVEVFSLGETN